MLVLIFEKVFKTEEDFNLLKLIQVSNELKELKSFLYEIGKGNSRFSFTNSSYLNFKVE